VPLLLLDLLVLLIFESPLLPLLVLWGDPPVPLLPLVPPLDEAPLLPLLVLWGDPPVPLLPLPPLDGPPLDDPPFPLPSLPPLPFLDSLDEEEENPFLLGASISKTDLALVRMPLPRGCRLPLEALLVGLLSSSGGGMLLKLSPYQGCPRKNDRTATLFLLCSSARTAWPVSRAAAAATPPPKSRKGAAVRRVIKKEITCRAENMVPVLACCRSTNRRTQEYCDDVRLHSAAAAPSFGPVTSPRESCLG